MDLLLWCPECGARHIDEGVFATKEHHTHACQSCGMVWRPAIEPTRGVRFLPGFGPKPQRREVISASESKTISNHPFDSHPFDTTFFSKLREVWAGFQKEPTDLEDLAVEVIELLPRYPEDPSYIWKELNGCSSWMTNQRFGEEVLRVCEREFGKLAEQGEGSV